MTIGEVTLKQNSHINVRAFSEIQDWDANPVYLTREEEDSISFTAIKSLSESQRPSELAGLRSNEILSTVKIIDRLFDKSFKRCQTDLENAYKNDLKILEPLNGAKMLTKKAIIKEGFKGLLKFRVREFIQKLVAARLYVEIENLKRGVQVKRGSTNRIAWLKKVETLEEERLKKTRVIIIEGSTSLIQAYLKAEKKGNILIKKLREIVQLTLIFMKIFKGESFTVSITKKLLPKDIVFKNHLTDSTKANIDVPAFVESRKKHLS